MLLAFYLVGEVIVVVVLLISLKSDLERKYKEIELNVER